MKRNTFKSGDWLAICDSCGLTFYASQLRKRWDELMVCELDWEPRHPQDFVRGIPDNPAPPWVRPKPDEVPIVSVSSNTILSTGVISVYATGNSYTITLPLANAVSGEGSGFTLQTGDTSLNVVLARQGGDLINQATSITLRPNTKYLVTSDNVSNWTAQ